MREAHRAGIPESQAWDMTPAQLERAIDGYADRLEDQKKLHVISGYYAAALKRKKRIPPLDSILSRVSTRDPDKGDDREGPKLTEEEKEQEWSHLRSQGLVPEDE